MIECQQENELLSENERRFRTITNILPVGISYTDLKGDFLFVNEQWCRITGLTADESQGNGWMGALHGDDLTRVLKEWVDAVKAKKFLNRNFALFTLMGRLRGYCA